MDIDTKNSFRPVRYIVPHAQQMIVVVIRCTALDLVFAVRMPWAHWVGRILLGWWRRSQLKAVSLSGCLWYQMNMGFKTLICDIVSLELGSEPHAWSENIMWHFVRHQPKSALGETVIVKRKKITATWKTSSGTATWGQATTCPKLVQNCKMTSS